jgi:hypothetical protein
MGLGINREVVEWIGSEPLNVTAAVTLGPDDQLVHATIPAAGTYEITLPFLHERPGARILIRVVATSGGTSVTVNMASSTAKL